MAMKKVSDATEGEAHRLLMDRLPKFMVGWVVAETAKLSPCAMLCLEGMYEMEALRTTSENMAGVLPKNVKAKAQGGTLSHLNPRKLITDF